MDLTTSAIDRIAELARQSAGSDVHREVGGQIYSPVAMHRVMQPDPLPSPLSLRALRPLVAYVGRAASRDGVKDLLAVHVESPTKVSVIGPLTGYHRQRAVYAEATVPPRREGTEFAFGRWIDVETMIISLQALFVEASDRARVLSILGNLRDESVGNASDDGVTQTVSVKAGITLAASTSVPNPVVLAPFRTFPEVTQPVSPFILRLKRDVPGMKGIAAGLWEADGGYWQTLAMASIEEYLRTSLPEGIEVLA